MKRTFPENKPNLVLSYGHKNIQDRDKNVEFGRKMRNDYSVKD